MKYTKEQILLKFEEVLNKKYKDNDLVPVINLVISFLDSIELSETDRRNVDLFKNMINLFDMITTMGPDSLNQLKDIMPEAFSSNAMENMLKNMFDNKPDNKSKDDEESDTKKEDDSKIN